MKLIARIRTELPEKFGVPRQSGLVPQLAKLEAVRAAVDAHLKPEEVEAVEAMIDAIGTVDLSKAGAISAARSAYDKLTDAEKALVTN